MKDKTGTARARTTESGFTLIEMAIVIAIAGVLVAMLAPVLGSIAENNRSELTVQRMNAIEDAMVVFVRQNGRLPCPAAPNGSPLGEERASCNTGGNANGVVPFRTVGLAEADARDGYGNYFTYHVAEDYADSSLPGGITDPGGFCFVSSGVPNGDLDVEDLDGNNVTGQDIAYVVLSHGKNGYGRYNPPGNNQIDADGGGTFEDENSDGNAVFVEGVRLTADAADGPLDDTIAWRTRDGIADRAIEFGCAADAGGGGDDDDDDDDG